ncbi:MAG: sigma-54 dependent transcriptional regulator [Myxococcales bacterium]|nr:sigma-54 dependent transcriptional regulator [Myxococcales bacterium]MDD9965758.1 sigma-54 dependent transcriptional regulator [Myxococcales bacterium]
MSDRPSQTVLIADDQQDVLEALRILLKSEGFRVVTASSPAGVEAALDERGFDAVLMDLNYARDTTSGREGLDLLGRLHAADSTLPVIVMTAWGSVEGAVEAMRRGARDYVQKPWDNARLVSTLRTQAELGQALRKARRLEDHDARHRDKALPEVIARSKAMQPAVDLVQRVGPSDANVLITGQHGTGKEVIARWLHAVSPRKDGAFVPVNAGALGEGVLESELFGHVRGAFTDAKSDRTGCFEVAEGGTLFLDEIANMPTSQQAKLLRVLQTGEYHPVGSSRIRHANVRVVSATNADIGTEVAAGRFREDLLYRLNTVEIALPGLRDRPEDIPHLATHFLQTQRVRYGKPALEFAPATLEALSEHPWPGNVRELEHVVERAVLMAQGDAILVQDLGLRSGHERVPRLEAMTLEEVERTLVQKSLAKHAGNASEAAKALGLSRSAFYRRMQQFGLKGSG